MLKSGIYKITNTVNGKIYIGCGANVARRWREHKSDLNLKRHNNCRLQNAWNKYWNVSFKFEVIEYCEKEKLLEREQYWLDITKCYDRNIGYNIASVAGRNSGHKLSDEAKLKMSIAAKNRSTEHKQKIGDGNRGKKISDETKIKMSIAALGKRKSKEHALNISKGKLGKKHKILEGR